MIVYEHKQKGTWFWLILGIVAFDIAITAGALFSLKETKPDVSAGDVLAQIAVPLFIGLPVLVWAGLLMSSLTVRIDESFVFIRFGGGGFRKRFLVSQIVSAAPVRNSWLCGWGIHCTFGGWLYNVAGLDAVELTFKNGKRVRIGTDEPEKLAEAVRSVLSAPSS